MSAFWEPETLEPSELKDIAVLRTMLNAKLRRVGVRQADLNDVGSARIDPACFRSPGSTCLWVDVVDLTNVARLTVPVIEVGGDPAVVPNSIGLEALRTPHVQSGERR